MMALAMAMLWFRSFWRCDRIGVAFNGRQHDVFSADGVFLWFSDVSGIAPNILHEDVSMGWVTDSPRSPVYRSFILLRTSNANRLAFAYWTLAIPLTLLSTYLILWKPREKPHAVN